MLVIDAIVEVAGGKSLCVPLQGVDLLDLTAVRQTNVVDTKVVLSIVTVRRQLTPMICEEVRFKSSFIENFEFICLGGTRLNVCLG